MLYSNINAWRALKENVSSFADSIMPADSLVGSLLGSVQVQWWPSSGLLHMYRTVVAGFQPH